MSATTTAQPSHDAGSATRLIVAASLGNALEFYEILVYIMATALLSLVSLVILRGREKSLQTERREAK